MNKEINIEFASPLEITKLFRGLSLGSLANLRSARKGPRFYIFGKRKILYKVEDVRRFLEENVVKTSDQHD